MFTFTPIVIVLFITTAINIVISYISWQRRKTKGGTYFSLGIFGITFWTLAAMLDYAATPLGLKTFFAKAEAIGYYSAIALFAVFSISYAGHERWLEKRWVKAAFVSIPLTAILLTLTNEFHHAIWSGFVQKSDNIVVFEHGPAFNWGVIANYIFIAIMFINLWTASRKGSNVTRRQARILMLALLFPVAVNLLYREGAWGIEGVDWTSITFSISGLLFLYALHGIRLLDIVPIARDKLVNSISDSMIVLDVQNRIIDINQTAAQMLGGQTSAFLGKSMAEVAPPILSFLDQPLEHEQKFELESGDASGRHFDVLISPIYEHGSKNAIGRLIISHDITKRKFTEKALEQRLFEIEKLHQELQQAQTQLVEQQRGLAKAEERQRIARNLHDSLSQSIHSLGLFSDTLAAAIDRNDLERARRVLERVQESARQAHKETRLLLYELQNPNVERITDLVQALEERLERVERHTGVKARVIQVGSLECCPQEWYENLFWITIESLNNALKHAFAQNVEVRLRCSPQSLELEVNDDGVGFNAEEEHFGGMGLDNLHARAQLLGGTLTIESQPEKGTTICFRTEIPHTA